MSCFGHLECCELYMYNIQYHAVHMYLITFEDTLRYVGDAERRLGTRSIKNLAT